MKTQFDNHLQARANVALNKPDQEVSGHVKHKVHAFYGTIRDMKTRFDNHPQAHSYAKIFDSPERS